MNPEDIKLDDWQRIFIGDVPPAFLFEIVLRVVVLYFLLILSMRILGKRMASQLTRNELAGMSALAATIGIPLLSPERGILPPFMMAIVVVSVSRYLSLQSARKPRIEAVTQGGMETLVRDSVLDPKVMRSARISRERILAQLRSEKVIHLGEVKRLFMEVDGTFTLVRNAPARPGLPVIPEKDREFFEALPRNGLLVCTFCGNENKLHRTDIRCSNCGKKEWITAVE